MWLSQTGDLQLCRTTFVPFVSYSLLIQRRHCCTKFHYDNIQMEYTIRKFEPRDAQQVTDLYRVCLATAYKHKGQHVANLQNWFANSKLSEGGDMHDVWEYYMTGKHRARCFWVAECNGEIVGCVGAMESTKFDDSYIELVRLAVSDSMRGKGVGSALTKAFEDFGISLGYAHANLSTLQLMDMAVSLYNKHGYSIVEHVQVPVPEGVEGWGDIPIIVVHLTKTLIKECST